MIPILKQNKDYKIAQTNNLFFTFIQNTREKLILSHITENIPVISHQHGFKLKHSTHPTSHNFCHQIIYSFQQSKASSTIAIALDISKIFDTVNIQKLRLTNFPSIIIAVTHKASSL